MKLRLRPVLFYILVGTSMFGAGCSCEGPKQVPEADDTDVCTDLDADGYGHGFACRGEDCDDSNPEVFAQADCDALCDIGAHGAGCACDHEATPMPEICYLGDPAVLTIGVCRSGFRRCTEDGVWTECLEQILPTPEACDGVDNDCDGSVDEGVTNDCGTCATECFHACVGAECDDFDPDGEGDNLDSCDATPNCVTLGAFVSLDVIWIVNTSESTVSRFDTGSREEQGRYILTSFGRSYQAYPSRTSVDFRGDVVVGNRAYGQMSSATKVGYEDCPAGETSTGRDDVLAWGEDACILWNTDIAQNGVANAVAVEDRRAMDGSTEEYVWVGTYNERRYYELDRTTGEMTGEEADCSPCTPYGAAIDRDGRLWSACVSANLCTFETDDPGDTEMVVMPGYNYSVAFDEDGRVWTGGTCAVYDPDDEEWTTVPNCSGYSVAADQNGSVWMSSAYCNGVYGTCRIDIETLETTGIAATSYGLAIDFDGQVWGIPSYQTAAYIIDPGDGPGDEEFERVELGLTGPDTYQDMTGIQLRNSTGTYGHVFEGCDTDTTVWTALLVEAATPTDSTIAIEVRTANTLPALPAQPWIPLGSLPRLESPIDLSEFLAEPPHGHFIEVRFTLSAEGDSRPELQRIEVQWECDLGPG